MKVSPRSALLCTTVFAAMATTQAWAQNQSSFTSDDLAVDLSAVVATPAKDCENFAFETTYDYTIFSAEVIPATDTVPEHCRVDGLIQPEIRFQVNLPTEWNGRFYMHGNGGYAGTQPNSPGRAAYRDAALAKGFGTAYTDTRHDSAVFPLGTFAYQDQAAEVDYT